LEEETAEVPVAEMVVGQVVVKVGALVAAKVAVEEVDSVEEVGLVAVEDLERPAVGKAAAAEKARPVAEKVVATEEEKVVEKVVGKVVEKAEEKAEEKAVRLVEETGEETGEDSEGKVAAKAAAKEVETGEKEVAPEKRHQLVV